MDWQNPNPDVELKQLIRGGNIVNKKKVQRLLVALDLRVMSYTRKSIKYNSYKNGRDCVP